MNTKIIVIYLNEGGHGITFFPYEYETAKLRRIYQFSPVPADKSNDQLLDEVFHVLNVNHPENYKNRSLSVGDVVSITIDDETTYYAVDTFGFKTLDWEPTKATIILDKWVVLFANDEGDVDHVFVMAETEDLASEKATKAKIEELVDGDEDTREMFESMVIATETVKIPSDEKFVK